MTKHISGSPQTNKLASYHSLAASWERGWVGASPTYSACNGRLRIPEPTGRRKAKGETGDRQLGAKLEERSPSQVLAITSFGSEHLILSASS